MLREALVGSLLEHPNILQMHSFNVGKSHFYFFYEYLPGYDLSDYVTRNGRIQEDLAKSIFIQMVDAVGKFFFPSSLSLFVNFELSLYSLFEISLYSLILILTNQKL